MPKSDRKVEGNQLTRRQLLRFIFIPAAVGAVSTLANAGLAMATDGEEPDELEPFPIAYDDVRKVNQRFRRKVVDYDTTEPPGTIVVDVDQRFLYLVLPEGEAMRYGIGVGRQGFEWSGTAIVRRKAKWPRWIPPKEMVARDPLAAKWADGMPGGPDNPLGARALYLFQGEVDTLFRIHGTSQPDSIGKAVSSGCIRLLNADIIDLFERVPLGTRVVVLPSLSTLVREEEIKVKERVKDETDETKVRQPMKDEV